MDILIAEDDTVSRRLLRLIVESQPGYKVIEVSDGVAAWNLLQQGLQPDLCLLDIQIPGMDGLELLRRIRSDKRLKNMKVILCSSVNERESIAHAITLSISYYILKPYVKAIILEQIRKVALQLDFRKSPESTVEVVCERLGITIGTYLTMRKTLADEIVKAVQALRKSLKAGDPKTTARKLYCLKGASLNLGIDGLVSMICGVESALETTDSVAPPPDQSAPHGQLVVKRLADLEKEAQRLLDEA